MADQLVFDPKWDRIKIYLKQNYNVLDESKTEIAIGARFGEENRSQIIIIEYTETRDDIAWLKIISRCGQIPDRHLAAAMEYVGNCVCGGLIKIGDNHFVRITAALSDLDADALNIYLSLDAMLADEIEKNYVGGDNS